MEPSSEFPPSFFRVTIKGLCVRDGKILMVRESPNLTGGWELPGGGLDFGEDVVTGFKREVKEEMGLTVTKMSKRPIYVWSHRYDGRRKLKWFYSFVVAYRVEFEDLNITKTDECEAIEFFSKDELAKLEHHGQMARLPEIFDPADFTEAF